MLAIEPLCSVTSTGSVSPIPSFSLSFALHDLDISQKNVFSSVFGQNSVVCPCIIQILCSTSDWLGSQILSIPGVIPLLGTLAEQEVHQTIYLLWWTHWHTQHTMTRSPVSSAAHTSSSFLFQGAAHTLLHLVLFESNVGTLVQPATVMTGVWVCAQLLKIGNIFGDSFEPGTGHPNHAML